MLDFDIEAPLFHSVEQCEVECRSVEEVGPPVREAVGQSRASTEAEWCSLVDVRRFCEQRWLFVGDSFEGPEARGSVVEVISKAFIPYACHVYGYGLLNCVTL